MGKVSPASSCLITGSLLALATSTAWGASQAVLNTPLGDNLAMRISAYAEHSDGAIKNTGPAGGSSGHDNSGGRIAFRMNKK